MDHTEVGSYWNENAEAWTKLARAGFDVYRDYLNTPAFLRMLPEVDQLSGLDIGCGEGHNTRLLAQRGARMTALDISSVFIHYAHQWETQERSGISYQVASAVQLPFPKAAFDFATGFMSFMDILEIEAVLAEAYRSLSRAAFSSFPSLIPATIPRTAGICVMSRVAPTRWKWVVISGTWKERSWSGSSGRRRPR